MKQAVKKHEQDIEQMYADLWEKDVQAKKQKEESDAKEQMERNRETLRVRRRRISKLFVVCKLFVELNMVGIILMIIAGMMTFLLELR